jgi:hypothetical protein
MNNFFKAILSLCAIQFAFAAATPEQLANEIRTVVIPAIKSGSMNSEQVNVFFSEKISSTGFLNREIADDNIAFLRAAADSIGGGNCNPAAATGLLALTPADLGTVKNVIANGTSDNYDLYGVMMYGRKLWPADWLSPAAKEKLGLK